MSTIKVDTIATRTGSGNITASNTIAGTSATLSGTLGVTGASTLTGSLSAKGGAVFNEDSADVDFRVESNGNINMIHVDGGSDVVTIGGLTGTAGNEDAGYGPLQVGSTSTSSTIMHLFSFGF